MCVCVCGRHMRDCVITFLGKLLLKGSLYVCACVCVRALVFVRVVCVYVCGGVYVYDVCCVCVRERLCVCVCAYACMLACCASFMHVRE